MKQQIGYVSLLVHEYEEALAFYVDILGFTLIEDRLASTPNKRWVLVRPPGSTEACLLLAKASNEDQRLHVGNQTGGRVFLFLLTDDFWKDYHAFLDRGVQFVQSPHEEPHGTVAVFKDLYGNLWDLIQVRN